MQIEGDLYGIIFFMGILTTYAWSGVGQKEESRVIQDRINTRRIHCPINIKRLIGSNVTILKYGPKVFDRLNGKNNDEIVMRLINAGEEIPTTQIHVEYIRSGPDPLCLSLYNYYNIQGNKQHDNSQSVAPIQLYILEYSDFHLHIDFSIYLHPFSNFSRIQPVVVLLMNKRPKIYFLYLYSFLSNSLMRLHLILSNPDTTLLYFDYQITEEMLSRLEISVLDKSEPLSETSRASINDDINSIKMKLNKSSLLSKAEFFGYKFNSVAKDSNLPRRIRLYSNEPFNSNRKSSYNKVNLVAIYQQTSSDLNTRLTIGKPWSPDISTKYKHLMSPNCEQKTNEWIDDYLGSVLSVLDPNYCDNCCNAKVIKTPALSKKYDKITWVHSVILWSPVFARIWLYAAKTNSEQQNFNKPPHFLLFLTGKMTRDYNFSLDTTNLFQRVTIVSNVSLYNYNKKKSPYITIVSLKEKSYEEQQRIFKSFVKQSALTTIQTRTINFMRTPHNNKYEVEVLLDDARKHSYESIFSSHSLYTCWRLPSPQIYFTLNLAHWNYTNPLKMNFYLWKREDCRFKYINKSFAMASCDPLNERKIVVHGLLQNRMMRFDQHMFSTIFCNNSFDPNYKGIAIENSTTSPIVYSAVRFITNQSLLSVTVSMKMTNKDMYRVENCYLTNGQWHLETDRSLIKLKLANPLCINNIDNYNYQDFYTEMLTNRTLDKNGQWREHLLIPIDWERWTNEYGFNENKTWMDQMYVYCAVSKCWKDLDENVQDTCQSKLSQRRGCTPSSRMTLSEHKIPRDVWIYGFERGNHKNFGQKQQYGFFIVICLGILACLLLVLLLVGLGCMIAMMSEISSRRLRRNSRRRSQDRSLVGTDSGKKLKRKRGGGSNDDGSCNDGHSDEYDNANDMYAASNPNSHSLFTNVTGTNIWIPGPERYSVVLQAKYIPSPTPTITQGPPAAAAVVTTTPNVDIAVTPHRPLVVNNNISSDKQQQELLHSAEQNDDLSSVAVPLADTSRGKDKTNYNNGGVNCSSTSTTASASTAMVLLNFHPYPNNNDPGTSSNIQIPAPNSNSITNNNNNNNNNNTATPNVMSLMEMLHSSSNNTTSTITDGAGAGTSAGGSVTKTGYLCSSLSWRKLNNSNQNNSSSNQSNFPDSQTFLSTSRWWAILPLIGNGSWFNSGSRNRQKI